MRLTLSNNKKFILPLTILLVGCIQFYPSMKGMVILGTGEKDVAYDIQVNSLGEAYITGLTHGLLDETLEDTSSSYAVIAKYDNEGNLLWLDQFGGDIGATASAVLLDSEERPIMMGRHYDNQNQSDLGTYVFMRQYSSEGEVINTIPLTQNQSLRAAALDENDHIYFVGGRLGGEPTYRSYFAKADDEGNILFNIKLDSSDDINSQMAPTSITLDDNNVYVGGYFGQTVEGFIKKFDSEGNELNHITLDNYPRQSVTGITADPNGDITVAGDFWSDTRSWETYVARYDSDGNELWSVKTGTSESDGATEITSTADGTVYVTGHSSGIYNAKESAMWFDATAMKFSPEGERLWVHQFGSHGNDKGFAITTGPEGNVWVAGAVTARTRITQSEKTHHNMFLLLMSPEGDKLWVEEEVAEEAEEVLAAYNNLQQLNPDY